MKVPAAGRSRANYTLTILFQAEPAARHDKCDRRTSGHWMWG